jgi:hypothetical protein
MPAAGPESEIITSQVFALPQCSPLFLRCRAGKRMAARGGDCKGVMDDYPRPVVDPDNRLSMREKAWFFAAVANTMRIECEQSVWPSCASVKAGV